MFYKFDPVTQSHQPEPIVIPYWLKRYFEEENVSMNDFVKALCDHDDSKLLAIISEPDLKLYRACQEIWSVFRDYNPFAGLVVPTCVSGPASDVDLSKYYSIFASASHFGKASKEAVLKAIYYEAVLSPRTALGYTSEAYFEKREVGFQVQVERIDNCLVLIVEPSGQHIDMKAFAGACIDKLHSFMSFEDILSSPYMRAYMKAARAVNIQR